MVGLTSPTATVIARAPAYEDDLYVTDLASRDGGEYNEGRIPGYEIEGSQLVECSGEGAAYRRGVVWDDAGISCGDVILP